MGLIHSACFINHVAIGDVRTSPEETMPEPNPVDVVPSPATSISTPSPVKTCTPNLDTDSLRSCDYLAKRLKGAKSSEASKNFHVSIQY